MASVSDAQKAASERYRKASVKSFNVKFFPADADLYEWLQMREAEGKNAYVKRLIREDMERERDQI